VKENNAVVDRVCWCTKSLLGIPLDYPDVRS
jgi:hypothetical protein